MSNFFAALIALSMTLRVQRGSRSAEALSRKLQSHTEIEQVPVLDFKLRKGAKKNTHVQSAHVVHVLRKALIISA